MEKFFSRAVASLIATAMILTSAGTVYADVDVSSVQESGAIVSETENQGLDMDAVSDGANVSGKESESSAVDSIEATESVSEAQEDTTVTDSTVTEESEEVTLASDETSGTCGEDMTWTYDEGTATLTISGSGTMDDYSNQVGETAPWYDYSELIRSVTMDDEVTSIGAFAFSGCHSMTSIKVSEGVTYIGSYAFNGCTKLTSIELPQGITSIEDYAFTGCGLISIELPEGVTSIGLGAFLYDSLLTKVIIPVSVTKIGQSAFYGCGITEVIYAGTEEQWSEIAIEEGNSKLIDVYTKVEPPIITSQPVSTIVLVNSYAKFVVVASNVKSYQWQYSADGGNEWLDLKYKIDSSLSLKATSETFGRLYRCKVTGQDDSIVYSDVVTMTERTDLTWAFADGTLTISGSGEMGDYGTYLDRNNIPWYSYTDQITGVVIADGVTTISACAFYGCENLTNVTISDSVTSIGQFAFYKCTNLADIELPDSIMSIGREAFSGCSSLTSIKIPESTTHIYTGTFSGCENLQSAYIPISVTRIDPSAFVGCDSLTVYYEGTTSQWVWVVPSIGPDDAMLRTGNVHCAGDVLSITAQPEHVTSPLKEKVTFTVTAENAASYQWQYSNDNGITWSNLEDSATEESFIDGVTTDTLTILTTATRCGYIYRCQVTGNNEEVINSDSATLTNNISAEDAITGTCGVNLAWTYAEETLTISGSGAMDDYSDLVGESTVPWYDYRELIKCIVMDDAITSIGTYAFEGCSNLTNINLPEGITSIGEGVFFNCSSLVSIELPEGVTSIGDVAFYGCSSLSGIDLSNGVTSIGSSAFYGCKITSIELSTGLTCISDYAFWNCSEMTSIKVSDSVTSIEDSAFSGCTNIKKVIYAGTFEQWQKITIGANNECLTDAWIYFGDSSEAEPIITTQPVGAMALVNTYVTFSIKALNKTSYQWQYSTDDGNEWADLGDDASQVFEGATSDSLRLKATDETFGYLYRCKVTGQEDITVYSDTVTVTKRTDMTWIYEDGTLTISGIGEMGDYGNFYEQNIPWYSYNDQISRVVIDDGVTTISDYAFYNCVNLTDITIPDSVKSIGKGAFMDCSSLVNIDLPDSLENLGDSANCWGDVFSGCTSLTSIKIPANTTWIYADTFYNCGSLKSVYIPISVTRIDKYSFLNCDSLEDVYYEGTKDQWSWVCYDYPLFQLAHCAGDDCNIVAQPENAKALLKEKATFTVTAKNAASYQWQYSKNNGETWSNLKDSSTASSFIDGVTTDTMTILTTATRCGYIYRCQISGNSGDVINSDSATLTRDMALTITTQPKDTVGTFMKKTTFKVVAVNAVSYQWQYSKNNGTNWNTLKDSEATSTYLGGATSNAVTMLMNASRGSFIYRCKITGEDGTVMYTDSVKVLLFAINAQPESVQAKSGDTVTFNLSADYAASYQWYYQKAGSTSWYKLTDNTKASMLINGTTSDTLTLKMTKTRMTYRYRCKVIGQNGTSKYSDAVEILA